MPASARVLLGALALIALLIGGCNQPAATGAPTANTPTTSIVVTTGAPTSTTTVDRGPTPPDGEHATVATVTDGDTFQLTDGRKVRVLGIDSCEDTGGKKTPGGAQATADAEVLDDQPVILTTEPGVDVDQYGRILRYVWSEPTGDFGLYMVPADHTGIYTDSKGRHGDASPAYIDQLFAHDLDRAANPPSGRECGEYPDTAPAPGNDDGDVYVPIPDNDDDHHRGGRGGRFCGRWNPIC